MRHAPAVRVPCVAGPLWRALPVALVSLTTMVVVVWLLRLADVEMRWSLAVALISAVVLAQVSWRATRPTHRHLEWNGARWALLVAPQAPPLELKVMDVMMDLGDWLLLRTRTESGRVHWLPVSRSNAPADFRALCRAAYSRGPAPSRVLLPERSSD